MTTNAPIKKEYNARAMPDKSFLVKMPKTAITIKVKELAANADVTVPKSYTNKVTESVTPFNSE